jgi:hypothetical protein
LRQASPSGIVSGIVSSQFCDAITAAGRISSCSQRTKSASGGGQTRKTHHIGRFNQERPAAVAIALEAQKIEKTAVSARL